MRALPIFFSVLLLSGCATFPEVDAATGSEVAAQDFPELEPLETLAQPDQGYLEEDSAARLEGRINGLNRRADELRRRPIE